MPGCPLAARPDPDFLACPHRTPFRYDVFLSHSSADELVVRELAERLRAAGLRVWLDAWIIKPGARIILAIEEGLEHSAVLLFFMSAHSFGSDWATLEGHTALFRDPLNRERPFVPLRLDDAPIKPMLRDIASIDLRPAAEDISEGLQPAPMAPSPAPPEAGALQTFSVTTAQLLGVGAGWQVERREVEVRGRALELGDGVSLPLIAIPAGEFGMGSPADEPERDVNEGPRHRVRLEGFLMGQTPITQAQ